MQLITNQLPKTIVYGIGSFQQVGVEARKVGTKALLISDQIMKSLGNVDRAGELLEESSVYWHEYLGVETEPKDIYVDQALTLLQQNGCDHIIALGGGSCIDTAKAVAVLATNGGTISDYMNGGRIAEKHPLPLIAIPTTGGTGSEATDVTVVTNTANAVKMMIKQEAFIPQKAIVDPVLTVSSPPHITAATGIDALTHALEAYISKKAHPFTDMLALSALERIYHHIEIAYHDGENLQARHELIYGSMLAGMAFSNASVCLVHGMSRPIGALFDVPHGVSNAMLLPVVLEYTKESCRDRLAEIARVLMPERREDSEMELSDALVESFISLCARLDIPTLRQWGIDEELYASQLEKMAVDALESGSPQNNPRVPAKAEIMHLYEELFSYEQRPVSKGK
ncbi:iron-containing alcohol dehydrogenase [Alkalihalobacillus oceani]|uniref:iron-containing alcohol dehydrogenase n=1 Tax=Halalkalibacter oceani TaxID=1653776 RepID=UPI00203F7811|nr:iron-containing alcohol dehydrogenase [Halalkalibacter oceani]MCM3761970.1 iron-containing alcohol dehydrogenase [Halalkalibacter oceani]